MVNVVAKIESTGNRRIVLTERGASFGYNTLVTDMRALPEMMKTGYPVVMDATHSVQQPGGQGGSSGGQREFAPVMARAAVSLGIAGVFIETHEDPDRAPSDGPNMIPLAQMPALIRSLMAFDALAESRPDPHLTAVPCAATCHHRAPTARHWPGFGPASARHRLVMGPSWARPPETPPPRCAGPPPPGPQSGDTGQPHARQFCRFRVLIPRRSRRN